VSVKVSIDKYNIRYLGNNMDLRALIARMDLIESKQILNESVYEGGMDELAAELGQIADNEDYDKLYDLLSDDGPVGAYLQDKIQDITGETGLHPKDDFEQIESMLMDIVKQEFGGQNDDEGGETDDNYAMTSAGFGSDEDYESLQYEDQEVRFKSNIAQQLLRDFNLAEAEAPLTNPWPEGSPQAQAWTKLSATDQKWIGQADPTDKFILARAPNKGAPEAGAATKPAPVIDKSTPAAGAADMDIGFGPGKFQPDATPAPGAANPADMDIGFGPGKFQPDATPAPAAGAATKPAAKPKDPAVLKLQQDLIAKGAKIQADGIMGPETQAAMKQFGGTTGAPDPAKMKRFKELLAKAGATA
jgi:hypothetical protein